MRNNENESKKMKYSDISNIKYVYSAVHKYEKSIFVLLVFNIIFAGIGSFVPVFMPKLIIDELINNRRGEMVLYLALLFGVLMLITSEISQLTEQKMFPKFIKVRLRMILESGQKFMKMDYQNLENPEVLDLSQKGDRACDSNNIGVEGIMHQTQWMLAKMVTLFSVVAIIVFVNPIILLLIAGILVINVLFANMNRKKEKKFNDELAPFWRTVYYVTNTMSDFKFGKDIRLFSMENFMNERLKKEQNNRLEGQCKVFNIWKSTAKFYTATGFFQEIILYAWLCYSVLYNGMSVGEFTMYAAAIRTFASALGGIFDDISIIHNQNKVVSDFRDFLTYPDRKIGGKKAEKELISSCFSIEFKDVSFKYPGKDVNALENVNIKIEKGEKLAVVGLNGAGKTTFIKLLMRLYEPDSGVILIDGKDASEYEKDEYFKLFAPVFQEIKMFAFSVSENVSMQEINKTDEEKVIDAIEKAGLDEKINSLPKKINQSVLKVIDDDGVEFSGGENQKLALARALYKNANTFILDEPSSALDSLAEERLYKEFDDMARGKTTIYISHRLASTRFCDRIIMFEKGKIVETGTHDELIENKGKYAEIFEMQAKYYKQGVTVE